MFGMGISEILFILVVGLIIFGPGKLPEIGRTLGKALGEFRKATDDIMTDLQQDNPADKNNKKI